MMKKITYLILIPLMLLAGSCKDFLNEQPLTDLSSEKFWKTADDARLGMAGIYDGLQTTSGSFLEWGDARSDNFMAGGTGLAQINLAINSLNPTLAASSWANLYRTIARANVGIKYLPNISSLSEKDRNHYLAQCHAIRALMYFYAIRLWGDVPVWLEPYEDISVDAQRPRTPVAEIMPVIIADLVKAETLVDPTKTVVYEINIGSILAMQTEVYMWLKDYNKAITSSGKLIALNRYGLAPRADWKKIFTTPGVTRENIFNIFWDPVRDSPNGNSSVGGDRTTQLIGGGDIDANFAIDNTPGQESAVHLRFQSQRAAGDIRAELTYDARLITSSTRKIGKYFEQNQPYPQTVQFAYPPYLQGKIHYPVYRYADILLLRAEAYNQLNSPNLALPLLNEVRARAGLTTPLVLSSFPTVRSLETAILDERQIELYAEGKRWFDLIRTGRVLEVMDPVIRIREVRLNQIPEGFTDPRKILFPISRAALTANTKLTQNQPWSE